MLRLRTPPGETPVERGAPGAQCSSNVKLSPLKPIPVPHPAWLFPVDHNHLIWYGFLNCVEFRVMDTVRKGICGKGL